MGKLCALTPALVKYFPEEKQGGILSSWETTMLGDRLLQKTILIYSPWLQAGKELQTLGLCCVCSGNGLEGWILESQNIQS